MIRINLIPSKKRKSTAAVSGGSPTETRAAMILAIMAIGWGGLVGVMYWLQSAEADKQVQLTTQAGQIRAKVEQIRKQIDEERLQAIRDRNAQLKAAIEKLVAQRRTPVYVMHEVANVLTTGKGPDIDEEEYRRLVARDPEAKLNPMWDASSVWVNSVSEKGNSLTITGGARDANDLSEFVKRLRASRRFATVTHPNFRTVDGTADKRGLQYVDFNMSVQIAYWD